MNDTISQREKDKRKVAREARELKIKELGLDNDPFITATTRLARIEESIIVRNIVIKVWQKAGEEEKHLIEGLNPDIDFRKHEKVDV